MKRAVVFLCLACVLLVSSQALATSDSTYRTKQQIADELYEKGRYTDALVRYLDLARSGDVFSQYAVSYMYLSGEGDDEDLAKAWAWAWLAARSGNPQLLIYREAVAGLVPVNDRRRALRTLDYYYRRWGSSELAKAETREIKRELRECTGSRLGTRCEEVYAMEMPVFWSINPGGGPAGSSTSLGRSRALSGATESPGGSASSSGSSSVNVAGNAGGEGRDIDYYQALREEINAINLYLREQRTRVELGEFEVIEPESEDQPAEEADEQP